MRDDSPIAMSSSLRRGFGSYFSRGSPAPSAMSASSDSVGQSSVERARIEGGAVGLGREEEVEASAEGSSSVEVVGMESAVGSDGNVEVEGSEGVVVEGSEEEGGGRSEGTRWVQDSSVKERTKVSSYENWSSGSPISEEETRALVLLVARNRAAVGQKEGRKEGQLKKEGGKESTSSTKAQPLTRRPYTWSICI